MVVITEEMDEMVKQKEKIDLNLTDIQQLQLDTGLSESICKKLLQQGFDYTYGELFEVMAVFEKVPLSLIHPILKYVCLSVLQYNLRCAERWRI